MAVQDDKLDKLGDSDVAKNTRKNTISRIGENFPMTVSERINATSKAWRCLLEWLLCPHGTFGEGDEGGWPRHAKLNYAASNLRRGKPEATGEARLIKLIRIGLIG